MLATNGSGPPATERQLFLVGGPAALWLMSRKSPCGAILLNTCLLVRVRDLAIVDTSGNFTLSAGTQKVVCILYVPAN